MGLSIRWLWSAQSEAFAVPKGSSRCRWVSPFGGFRRCGNLWVFAVVNLEWSRPTRKMVMVAAVSGFRELWWRSAKGSFWLSGGGGLTLLQKRLRFGLPSCNPHQFPLPPCCGREVSGDGWWRPRLPLVAFGSRWRRFPLPHWLGLGPFGGLWQAGRNNRGPFFPPRRLWVFPRK